MISVPGNTIAEEGSASFAFTSHEVGEVHRKGSSFTALVKKPGVLPLVMFVIGGDIAVWRGRSFLIPPQFYAEGGAVWYRDAYEKGPWAPLFHPHAGYINLFPRLVADLGLLFPLAWVPAFFVSVSLVVQVLPGVFFVTDRFSHVCRDQRVRVFIAMIYFALPNSWEVSGKLTNAQWHLALLLVMVLLAIPAKGLLQRLFDIAVIVVAGLSGPYSIALLPIVGLWFLQRHGGMKALKNANAVFGELRNDLWELVIVGLSLVVGLVELGVVLTAPRSKGAVLGASLHWLQLILTGPVITALLLGQGGYEHLYYHHWWIYASLPITFLGIGFAGLILFRGFLELKLFTLYGALIAVGGLADPIPDQGRAIWPLMNLPGVSDRYWFVLMVGIVVGLVWAAGRERAKLCRILATVALAAILLVGIPFDWQMPGFVNYHFEHQVAVFERAPKGASVVFKIDPPGWTMVLRKH